MNIRHNLRSHWRQNVIAGLSVAIIIIPQSLAYAQIAGLPAYYGLYASLLPVAAAAMWGSSRQLSTGPAVVVALLTASSLSVLATPGSSDFVLLAALLALLVGVFQIFLGVLKLGSLIQFISHPVITGFINAAAVLIALSQIPKLVGLSADRHTHVIQDLWGIVDSVHQIHPASALLGIIALCFLVIAKRLKPAFPRVLVVVVLGTSVSALLAFDGPVVGTIPAGLPQLTVPQGIFNLANLRNLIIPTIVVSLVGYMESMSVAKSIASITRQHIRPSKELIGQGVANLTSSFSGSFPVAGSLSRSAVNFQNGASTPLSALVTTTAVFITLLFFTPLLSPLPQTILGAVIIASVLSLIKVSDFTALINAYPGDGLVAILTFLATFALAPHLDYGILIGIGASLLLYAYRAAHPHISIAPADEHAFSTRHRLAIFDTNQLVLCVSLNHSLIFTNAEYLKAEIEKGLAANPNCKYVFLLCHGINTIDATAAEVIEHLVEDLRSDHIAFFLVRVRPAIARLLKESSIFEIIGKDNIFVNATDALTYVHLKETHHKKQSRSVLKVAKEELSQMQSGLE